MNGSVGAGRRRGTRGRVRQQAAPSPDHKSGALMNDHPTARIAFTLVLGLSAVSLRDSSY